MRSTTWIGLPLTIRRQVRGEYAAIPSSSSDTIAAPESDTNGRLPKASQNLSLKTYGFAPPLLPNSRERWQEKE